MQTLTGYVVGRWVAGDGKPVQWQNPTTEEAIAESREGGIDFKAAVAYAK